MNKAKGGQNEQSSAAQPRAPWTVQFEFEGSTGSLAFCYRGLLDPITKSLTFKVCMDVMQNHSQLWLERTLADMQEKGILKEVIAEQVAEGKARCISAIYTQLNKMEPAFNAKLKKVQHRTEAHEIVLGFFSKEIYEIWMSNFDKEIEAYISIWQQETELRKWFKVTLQERLAANAGNLPQDQAMDRKLQVLSNIKGKSSDIFSAFKGELVKFRSQQEKINETISNFRLVIVQLIDEQIKSTFTLEKASALEIEKNFSTLQINEQKESSTSQKQQDSEKAFGGFKKGFLK